MYYQYSQEELRTICKNSIESFEQWARRLIHQKLMEHYGENYFNAENENGDPIFKKELKQNVEKLMSNDPSRFPRQVDALFLEDIIYIICKQELYSKFFKEALDYAYPKGKDIVFEFLGRLIEPRNRLSHSNPISIRQAERVICYTNDFIDGMKEYYKDRGCERMWNVPQIINVKDSLGNVFYPDSSSTLQSFNISKNNGIFRPGDVYKVAIEVDQSFEKSAYSVLWKNTDKKIGNEHELTIIFSYSDIGDLFLLSCEVVSNKEWHKHRSYDDKIYIHLSVLPPLE